MPACASNAEFLSWDIGSNSGDQKVPTMPVNYSVLDLMRFPPHRNALPPAKADLVSAPEKTRPFAPACSGGFLLLLALCSSNAAG